ncbi:MAG: D-alanine--D-alanine ligase [Proteobacteria bacterium]|nr:D-alanine--D-alanine ligase [Pseudomonadota bacterium]
MTHPQMPAIRTRPQVTVLLGDPTMPDATKLGGRYAEEDIKCVEQMKAALESLDAYDLRFMNRHTSLLADIEASPPAFVLNFCDTGFRNQPRHEWHLAGFFELLDIPYSGAPPFTMAVCYDKGAVRGLAAALGIAVPDERYCAAPHDAIGAIERYPVLIKPNQGDGSVGITKDAVIHNRGEAEAYLDYFSRTLPGQAVLVQEFLSGIEYGVGVIGNPATGFTVLPPLEVDYSELDSGLAPILPFESKVDPTSPYWTKIKYRKARLDESTRQALADTACRLFVRLGLRDYGRFDFRTGADGVIKLLEVNPNPAWDYGAKLAFMAGFAGMSYAEMLGLLVETALARVSRKAG